MQSLENSRLCKHMVHTHVGMGFMQAAVACEGLLINVTGWAIDQRYWFAFGLFT